VKNPIFLLLLLKSPIVLQCLPSLLIAQVQCLEDFHRFVSPKVNELIKILHGYKPDESFSIKSGGVSYDDFEAEAASDDSMEDEASDGDGEAAVVSRGSTASRGRAVGGKSASEPSVKRTATTSCSVTSNVRITFIDSVLTRYFGIISRQVKM